MMKFILSLILASGVGCHPAFAIQKIITGPNDRIEGIRTDKDFLGGKGFFETAKQFYGWLPYADAAGTTPVDMTGGSPNITCTRNTGSLIGGVGSLLITKGAANRQGEGCSIAFSVEPIAQGEWITIPFRYLVNSGTYATDDLKPFLYDVTNSAVIDPIVSIPSVTGKAKPMGLLGFRAAANAANYRIGFHVASTSTSAYTVAIDELTVNFTPNIVNFMPGAQFLGSIAISGCAGSFATASSTSFVAFGTQTGCTYTTFGSALAPSTNIPAIRFNSVGPGEIVLQAEGGFFAPNTNANAYFRFHDGTTPAKEVSEVLSSAGTVISPSASQSFSYTAPKSNVTFALQGAASSGNVQLRATGAYQGSTPSDAYVVIKAYYFPSQALSAITPDQTNFGWTLYTPVFTGFGTVTNIECLYKRDSEDLKLRCKWTPGTTTATEARMSFPNSLVSAGTASIPSLSKAGNWEQVGAEAFSGTVLMEPNVGYVTFGKQGSGSGGASKLNGTGLTSTMTINASIPIAGWVENGKAPTLIGSVTSSSTASEVFNRAYVGANCTSSPCTITSQSNWLSSITRTTAGTYVANIASGIYSGAPTCTCSSSLSRNRICNTTSVLPTTTSVTVTVSDATNSSGEDNSFALLCVGPR